MVTVSLVKSDGRRTNLSSEFEKHFLHYYLSKLKFINMDYSDIVDFCWLGMTQLKLQINFENF